MSSTRTLVTLLRPWIRRFTIIISAWWLRTSSKFTWEEVKTSTGKLGKWSTPKRVRIRPKYSALSLSRDRRIKMHQSINQSPHSAELPPPLFTSLPEVVDEPESSTTEESSLEGDCYEPFADYRSPILITQAFLNDLVRDLNLPKESAELLGSRLQNNNLLAPNTTYSWYRRREKVWCNIFLCRKHLYIVTMLLVFLKRWAVQCAYDPTEWRLFIDSCKASLKCVLLHNAKGYASIPIGHSVHLKETYQNMKMLLTKIKYDEHKWMVCGDLEVLSILFGQQGGYTKYPCFLCLWNSRAKNEH